MHSIHHDRYNAHARITAGYIDPIEPVKVCILRQGLGIYLQCECRGGRQFFVLVINDATCDLHF